MFTAQSSDEELLNAINNKSYARPSWRRHDFPEPGEPNQRSWVTPNDIGVSTRRDPSLKLRLDQLADKGLLEKRYQSKLPRYRVTTTQTRLHARITTLAATQQPLPEINSFYDG